MIFVLGLPLHHHSAVIKDLVKALQSEQVTGLPVDARPRLTSRYIDDCIDTIDAFYEGRPNCLDHGLCILAVLGPGDDFSKLRRRFFPFALIHDHRLQTSFASSPAQRRREKNEIVRALLPAAKKLVKVTGSVTTYLQSRANRTPLLLPLRHFNEPVLSTALETAWNNLPSSSEPTELLENVAAGIEKHFPFKRRKRKTRGHFENSRQVNFTVPGQALHGAAHTDVTGHRPDCFLNGVLRTGGAMRTGFHYDCTRGGAKYSGTFANCHDENVTKTGNPHLNVFPNDYIR